MPAAAPVTRGPSRPPLLYVWVTCLTSPPQRDPQAGDATCVRHSGAKGQLGHKLPTPRWPCFQLDTLVPGLAEGAGYCAKQADVTDLLHPLARNIP